MAARFRLVNYCNLPRWCGGCFFGGWIYSEKSSISRSNLPWNKPSSYGGTPISGNHQCIFQAPTVVDVFFFCDLCMTSMASIYVIYTWIVPLVINKWFNDHRNREFSHYFFFIAMLNYQRVCIAMIGIWGYVYIYICIFMD